ncbi:MAG: hypothetical protein V7642_3735 [Burkholderiales bacterium]|jgi:acetyl-CoA C-acetyltransferase
MKPCIVGWAHTKFGKLDNIDLKTLITTVTRDAISESGVFCQLLAAYLH